MNGMRPPQLPEQPVDVVRAEQSLVLLNTCEGRDFTSRRDTAIVLLLVDTGMRRAECVGMTLDDVRPRPADRLGAGQGPRPRALPVGRKTAQALDRYLRAREGTSACPCPQLWVGPQRAHAPSGVYQVVHDRARAGAASHASPSTPASFATSWLAEGGNENELMPWRAGSRGS